VQLDDDATIVKFVDTWQTARVENWSQELRVYKDSGSFRETGGLYYLHIDASSIDLQRLFGLGGVQVASPFGLRTDSYSGFGQLEVDLAPQLTAIGGFRATKERKDFHYNAFVQTVEAMPIADGRSFHATSDDMLYSWKGELDYHPVEQVMLYTSYNRGVKAGGFNAPFAGGATPPDSEIPYKPERLDAYELGAKTRLLGGIMTLNGALFYYDYKDAQAYKFANFATTVTNNPATTKGAEMELHVRPAAGLELMAAGTYLDSAIKDVTVSNALGSAVLARRPPFTSKWKFTALARYEMPVANGRLAIQADAQYTSDFYFSLTNFDSTKTHAYTLLNARISWTDPTGHWEGAVYGSNLLDKRYGIVGFDSSDFGGFTQVGYGQPRWLGASIEYNF
jgi:iron complex outermembrane recepter protein